MKKYSTLFAIAFALLLSNAGLASSTIFLQAGNLTDETGAGLPEGSLILLIAAGTDSSFYNFLNAGQFVGGDDVLLAAESLNNNLDGATATSNTFNFAATASGQPAAVRWFSGFTLQQYLNNETPAAGIRFGTFAGLTTGSPNGGDAWSVPEDGGFLNYRFVTQSADPSVLDAYANSFGRTSSQATAVPEPAAWSLVVIGALVTLVSARRRLSRLLGC